MSQTSQISPSQPLALWLIVAGMIAVPCLYLSTLATRFDFIDDGNLVYPAGPMSLGERLQLSWYHIAANVKHLGPFRPVLWAHWEVEAELFHADAFTWRLARLLWLALATGTLLWLFRELGIRPVAALLTAALAMWNPYRSEIWTSLTLSEGVAMPYALGGLICAIRAARSRRPWPWDLAGALCVLAALGCKNTFAALVPAQLLLRLTADGSGLRTGWRLHGWRACCLLLPLLLPVGHFIYFKLHWHPGQYETGLSGAQVIRMLGAVQGALSLDFLLPGLIALVAALGASGLLSSVWHEYRDACRAGLVLLVSGIAIYLPLSAMSGRYSMPAVWGADMILAALLSSLPAVPALGWKRAAYGLLAGGLVAVMVSNLGKQQKFAARANLLWQALEYVEHVVPAGSCIAWEDSRELNREEGIHFCWHLQRRGRPDLAVRLIDQAGQRLERIELKSAPEPPAFLITGRPQPSPTGAWQTVQEFNTRFWMGQKSYTCYLWKEKPAEHQTP